MASGETQVNVGEAQVNSGEDLVYGDNDVVYGDSIVNGDKDIKNGNDDVVNGDKDAVNGDKDAVNGDKDAVNGDKDAVNGDKDIVNDDKVVVNGDKDVGNGNEVKVNGGGQQIKGDELQADGAEISWTVKKLSQWDIRLGRTIDSPLFRIKCLDNCSWYLQMTPRGETKGDHHLNVYLILFAGKLQGKINCELSFMCGMECINSGTVEVQTIVIGKSIKLTPSIMKGVVFHNNKKQFLPDDILSIRCRIWRTNILPIERISFKTEILSLCETFPWIIEKFSNYELNSLVKLSKDFLVNEKWFATISWHLSFKGTTLDDCSVEFVLKGVTNVQLLVACELKVSKEIEDEKEEQIGENRNKKVVVKTFRASEIFKYSRKMRPLKFSKPLPRRVLLEYLQNDSLTIDVNIRFVTGDYCERIEEITRSGLYENNLKLLHIHKLHALI